MQAHFDCTITGEGDVQQFEWRCREMPSLVLDGGAGGLEEAKFSALFSFRGTRGFSASWA
jgi:hypothetical protein